MATWTQLRTVLAAKTALNKIPWERLPGGPGFLIYHAKLANKEIYVYPDKIVYRAKSQTFTRIMDTTQWIEAIEAYLNQALTEQEALDDIYTTINTV